VLRKIFRGLLWTVLGGALVLVVLVKGFGLRVELYGQGYKPHFYFFKPEQHYAEIDKSRMLQKTEQKAAAPEPAAVAAPAPAASPANMPDKSAAAPTPSYWTSFRGPNHDGIYSETPVLTSWPAEGLTRLWKQPIGLGYASFAVGGGKAFTIEQRRDKEVVAAYNVKSGHELWTASWPAFFQEMMGGDGPRATPAFDDGRVYALGATGEFRCLDAETGKTIWSRNILTDNQAANLIWGMSGSPLIVDDKVIVQPGGAAGKSVAAYDKLTGKPVWTSLDDKQSYTSPMVGTLAGVRQIVVVSATRVVGLSIADGALLWQYPWHTDPETNTAEPVFIGDNRFFLSAGYSHGGMVLDVTRNGDGFSVKQVWQNTKMKTRFNTAVYYQGFLYGLDEGILACIDATTGDLKWKGGRYGYGQLLLASGYLIVLTEQGELVLVKASPEKLEEVSRFEAIDGKTWNYPAIDDGVLLVRNALEMAAFRVN
jgi:outer membrane protein assembly factor BamB